jgi:peptidoglycan/LPS O-acetylase OafA/YrhL
VSLSHPLPWFAVCALCLALGWALARTSGFYREQLAAAGAGRFASVDGLRGFLALGVLGAHAVGMYMLFAHDRWDTDSSVFHFKASGAGVGLFFMITGFLFWLRVLRAGAAFDAQSFLAARIRRLTPMYLMSVGMALMVIGAASGFALREAPAELARELRPWLSFGFLRTGEVNGVAEARYVNAVYWTLAFEWMFYLALPLLALCARGGWRLGALVAALLLFGGQVPVVFNFLFGALAAALVHWRALERLRLDAPWLAVPALASLAVYFAFGGQYGLGQSAALFGFFVFVVHGNSLLGLLTSAPARVLGTISYSIYLTHCIALFVTVRAVDAVLPIETLDGTQYWLLVALAAAGCVLLSAWTYRHVEHPFLHPQPARPPRRAPTEVLS